MESTVNRRKSRKMTKMKHLQSLNDFFYIAGVECMD